MLKVNIDIMLYKFNFNEIVETNERLYDKNFMTSYYPILDFRMIHDMYLNNPYYDQSIRSL